LPIVVVIHVFYSGEIIWLGFMNTQATLKGVSDVFRVFVGYSGTKPEPIQQ
jgi:hypothetical protein